MSFYASPARAHWCDDRPQKSPAGDCEAFGEMLYRDLDLLDDAVC